jgi:hypothetical protein
MSQYGVDALRAYRIRKKKLRALRCEKFGFQSLRVVQTQGESRPAGRPATRVSYVFCIAKNLQLKNGMEAIFGKAKAEGFRPRKGLEGRERPGGS